MFAVIVAELLLYLLLDRNRDSREQSTEPVELHHELPAHLSDGDRLASTSLHVDLLVVLQEFFIPVEQIGWWLGEADVHKSEPTNIWRICVLN